MSPKIRRCHVACLAVLLLAAPTPAAEPVRTNVHVLGIGFNQQGGDSHADDYNCFPLAVETTFRERGSAFYKDLHARHVLGKKATRDGILAGLAWLHEHASKDDLVVVYFGCHGHTHPTEGWGTDTMDGKPFWARDLKGELGRLPCPVLLVLETCGSGGFAQAHKNDPPVPANVTVLCACAARQTTDNHLDVAFAEALYGRGDFDRDGVVRLDELIRYVDLRYREWAPGAGKGAHGDTPVILKAKSMPGSMPLTQPATGLATVAHDGQPWTALLGEQKGGRYSVRLLGWNPKPGPYFLTDTAARDLVCLPADGKPLLVEQKGTWYPARLLERKDRHYRVRYLGYDEEETVTQDRVRHPFAGEPGEFAALPPPGTAGEWEQVGEAGAWKDTLAGAVLDGRLYTIEKGGALYATDLKSGEWKQVGKADFADTAFLFAAGDTLLTIETDGSLYRVNPADGSWKAIGEAGAWKGTIAGTILDGRLYTVEKGGALYATDLKSGEWKQVGKADFADTAFLFAAGDTLLTIETDGSLYRVNPADGSWRRLGAAGDWKGTLAGAVVGGQLLTAEANGTLWRTDPATGRYERLGRPEFAATTFAFPAGDKLYTIEKNGSLYRVSVR